VTKGWTPPNLYGQVALVTGASRGVGRGIALALGEAGATVYVSGRSTRDRVSPEGLPGTIDDTAEEVTSRGGTGIAVRCDHLVDEQVEALFTRIASDRGRLDLLVNNAWSGYERMTDVPFDAPFWRQPKWRYDLFAAGLRSQFTASQHAASMMMSQDCGLLVSIGYTDGDVYLGQAPYDMAKTAANRLSWAMAQDLRRETIASIALHPGFVRTERVEAVIDSVDSGPSSVVHSPEYVGRAAAMLLGDPEVMKYTGQNLTVGDLAQHYGFADLDGRQPPPFHLEGRPSLATRMEWLNRPPVRRETVRRAAE
jgi:NAD(P)-dependent dehydrogenase (short-subunit alcohol dehydrogenase family)